MESLVAVLSHVLYCLVFSFWCLGLVRTWGCFSQSSVKHCVPSVGVPLMSHAPTLSSVLHFFRHKSWIWIYQSRNYSGLQLLLMPVHIRFLVLRWDLPDVSHEVTCISSDMHMETSDREVPICLHNRLPWTTNMDPSNLTLKSTYCHYNTTRTLYSSPYSLAKILQSSYPRRLVFTQDSSSFPIHNEYSVSCVIDQSTCWLFPPQWRVLWKRAGNLNLGFSHNPPRFSHIPPLKSRN